MAGQTTCLLNPVREDIILHLPNRLNRIQVFSLFNHDTVIFIRLGQTEVVAVAAVTIPFTEIGLEASISIFMVSVRKSDGTVLNIKGPPFLSKGPDYSPIIL